MKVIFLDLDRTLIGDDYSPEPAKEIVDFLKERGFKVIFNSSKTRLEQEYYRNTLEVKDPFIVENGSAVYIPKNYFPFEFPFTRGTRDYKIIELGTTYEIIKRGLDKISSEFGLKYYGNSSIEEIVEFTGLSRRLAKLAAQREYSETLFKWNKSGFEEKLKKNSLKVSKGSRFYTVTGPTDKGKATRVLLNLYSKLEKVESYAVGDGKNDIPMLEVVDNPFAIGLSHNRAKNIKKISELIEVIT